MHGKNSAGLSGNIPKPILGHRTSQRFTTNKKLQACETAFRGNGIDGSFVLLNVCLSYRRKAVAPFKTSSLRERNGGVASQSSCTSSIVAMSFMMFHVLLQASAAHVIAPAVSGQVLAGCCLRNSSAPRSKMSKHSSAAASLQ